MIDFANIRRALQISKATQKTAYIVAINGWLDPTPKEFAFAITEATKNLRLTVNERDKMFETLTELRDDIVIASYKVHV